MAKKKSDVIDFTSLINSYRKNWYWFVISIFCFALLSIVYIKTHKAQYNLIANVLIDSNEGSPLLQSMDLGGIFGSSARVDDEVFIVASHSLTKELVKKLGLNVTYVEKTGLLERRTCFPDHPLELSLPAANFSDTISTSLRFKISVDKTLKADVKVYDNQGKIASVDDLKLPGSFKTPYGEFQLAPTTSYVSGENLKMNIYVNSYDSQAELLGKDVVADIMSRKSNIVELSMITSNIKYGKTILNELVNLYNQRGIDNDLLQGDKTIEFIDGRIAMLATDLDQEETAIQNYKQANGLTDVLAEAEYQTQRRGELEGRLLSAENNAEVLKITSEFLNNPANAYSLVPITTGNEGVVAAIKEYNNLLLQRMNMLNTASESNAVIAQLEQNIAAVRSNLKATLERVYRNSLVPLENLRAELNKTNARLGEVPQQEREYYNMKRQQRVKQQLYLFLLQRREETAMMIASGRPKAIIVDEAYSLTDPVSMSNPKIFVIFCLLGLIVPLLLIYFREMMRTKFETRGELENLVDAPVLGELCIDKTGNSVVVNPTDTSSTAELFRLLRTNLLFILNDSRDKVVMLTSTNSGEGKSFVSINLAMSLALLGKRVLLMGMDVRKPKLAEYLGMTSRYGVTQYLSSDNLTIDQLIEHSPSLPGLDIIFSGPVPPNPGELLSSRKVEDMFSDLRSKYDYIIVDTAPVGLVSDTFVLDRIADATIYVTRANYTKKNDLKLVNDIYQQHRLKKLSVVLNGAVMKKTYGYGEK